MDSYWGHEVAIVGSGLAGLICARHLHQRGLKTVIVEKSRGLGGRMATRRRDRVCFDHGLPGIALPDISISAVSSPSQALLQELLAQGIVQPGLGSWAHWQANQGISEQFTKTLYVASGGMTAIAKYLAQGLDIQRDWFLQTLTPVDDHDYWQLMNSQGDSLQAQAVVITVPAPQAVALLARSGLETFSSDLIVQLQSISYEPSLVVMAGYTPESAATLDFPWQGIEFSQHSTLKKIVLDSSKRLAPDYPLYVLQSTPDLARSVAESTDLSTAVQTMLQQASDLIHPILAVPQWSQVHLWRYALPQSLLNSAFLWAEQPLSLFFCGDGYGLQEDSTLQPAERAILSGFSAASALLATGGF